MIEIKCPSNCRIVEVVDLECEDLEGVEFPADPLEFIGMALHSMQQGQSTNLIINGYEIRAILMDQTCGSVSLSDIFKTNHKDFPYQRLSNILNERFEP